MFYKLFHMFLHYLSNKVVKKVFGSKEYPSNMHMKTAIEFITSNITLTITL